MARSHLPGHAKVAKECSSLNLATVCCLARLCPDVRKIIAAAFEPLFSRLKMTTDDVEANCSCVNLPCTGGDCSSEFAACSAVWHHARRCAHGSGQLGGVPIVCSLRQVRLTHLPSVMPNGLPGPPAVPS